MDHSVYGLHISICVRLAVKSIKDFFYESKKLKINFSTSQFDRGVKLKYENLVFSFPLLRHVFGTMILQQYPTWRMKT